MNIRYKRQYKNQLNIEQHGPREVESGFRQKLTFPVVIPTMIPRTGTAIRVLLVVTSHDQLGTTDKKTGWYLPEVAHPYHVFTRENYDIVFVSPKGGFAPMDPDSEEIWRNDATSKVFLSSKNAMELKTTESPSDINPRDFHIIFYAGGVGAMFDLPGNKEIANLCKVVHENGGIVSAVGEGSVGLVPVILTNGDALVKDKKVTGLTNAEAAVVYDAMPFQLEARFKQMGAEFVGADVFQENVQVSGRIITGQNPASTMRLAEEIVKHVQMD